MPNLFVIPATIRRAPFVGDGIDTAPLLRRGPRPVEILDAGAVPTSGTSANNQPAGTFEYATNVLVQGVIPQISPSAFGPRVAQTIAELVGGRADGADATITRGSQTLTEVPGNVLVQIAALAGAPVLAALGGPVLGVGASAAAVAAAVANRPARIPGYWVAIRGFFTAPTPWQVSTLNRAIARAFANTTTFGPPIPAFAGRMPPPGDGSLLLARLSQPDACTGGADYTAVYARACTRVAPASVMTPITSPTPPAPTPPAPTPPVRTPPAPTPPAPVRTTPVRATPTPVRTPAVTPQVLVPPPPPATSIRWYHWLLGGLALGSVGVAIWRRDDIARWWRRK